MPWIRSVESANANTSDRVHFSSRLEALRGLAALVVACFHASQPPWAGGVELIADPSSSALLFKALSGLLFLAFNGQGAVNLFFVLSGFVLAGSLARGPKALCPAVCRFITARVFRLYPAVWVTVIVYATLFTLAGSAVALNPGDITVRRVVLNLLLLDHSVNGVMWSLQVELLAVPLILLVALLGRGWGVIPIAVMTGVLFGMSFESHWTRGFGSGLSFNPLFCFTLGMLLYQGRQLVQRLGTVHASALLVVALCLFFVPRCVLGNSTGGFRWITILEGLGAAAIIGLVAYRPSARLAHLLDYPAIRFYGRISYSFYLLHPLSLALIWAAPAPIEAVARAHLPAPLLALLMASVSIFVVTPLAWLCWRHVELPGVAAGMWLNRTLVESGAALSTDRAGALKR
jgi:peptidoglycan/LPS O-acetylase OafA/YrhL